VLSARMRMVAPPSYAVLSDEVLPAKCHDVHLHAACQGCVGARSTG
jgi:hypothetical protein